MTDREARLLADLRAKQSEALTAMRSPSASPGDVEYHDGRASAYGGAVAMVESMIRVSTPPEAPPEPKNAAEIMLNPPPFPELEAPPEPDMGTGWFVTVGRSGESVVTIEERMLAGKPDLSDDDLALLRGAAAQLLAFAGSPAPPEPARCVWTENEFGSWDTGCGRCFEFNEGDPAFNNVRFCFYCGQPLTVETP